MLSELGPRSGVPVMLRSFDLRAFLRREERAWSETSALREIGSADIASTLCPPFVPLRLSRPRGFRGKVRSAKVEVRSKSEVAFAYFELASNFKPSTLELPV
jgi:hypothetical protein